MLDQLKKVMLNAYKTLVSKQSYQSDDLSKTQAYKNVINETNSIFQSALKEGIKDNIIPAILEQALKSDIFVFSALKTHAQLFEASRLLKDDTGKIKPFNRFLNDVQSKFKDYNELYLESEYQFAVGSSLMNVKWSEFENNTERYNLQYQTAGDEKVRASHAELDLITLPQNDPFWNLYFPPNGWRCRCSVGEVLKSKYPQNNSADAINKGEKATTQIGKDGKNRLEIFRFNPGKQKVIFPPNHPYRKLQGADSIIKQANDTSLYFNTIKNYPNGGSILMHKDVDTNSNDYQRVYQCCDYFAKLGHQTKIYNKYSETLNDKEYQLIFNDLKDTIYWGKCPDFSIDGVFYEHEGFETDKPKKAYRNMIGRGQKQSDKIVIDDCGLTDRYMIHNINTRVIVEKQKISEVWVLKDSKLRMIYPKNTKTS